MTKEERRKSIEERFKKWILKDENVNKIKEMRDALLIMYKEENFQIQNPVQVFDDVIKMSPAYNAFFFRIIIKFPEVEIKNSRGTKRLLTNVYVSMRFNENMVIQEPLLMARGTISQEEYYANYLHSHVNQGAFHNPGFHHVCTGSGPVNISYTRLRSKFDTNLLRMHLYNINQLVKWESLEGTPYINMSTIGTRNNFISADYSNLETDKLILNSIKRADDLINLLNVSYNKYDISVTMKDELSEQIANFLKNIAESGDRSNIATFIRNNISTFVNTRDTTGRYYRTNVNPSQTRGQLNTYVCIFKDTEIRCTISDFAEITQNKFYVNPGTKKSIERQLSNIITKSAYTNRIGDGSTPVDNAKVTVSDKVSV